jgi:hypothetical protein
MEITPQLLGLQLTNHPPGRVDDEVECRRKLMEEVTPADN